MQEVAERTVRDGKSFLAKLLSSTRLSVPNTILLVEDNIVWTLILEVFLQDYCDEIVTVATAEEGLQYLCKFSKSVSLIISDINLPGISGLEFLSEVKRNHYFRTIPIILQSGTSISKLEDGLALGADGFVQKPYTKEELYAVIKKINFNYEDKL